MSSKKLSVRIILVIISLTFLLPSITPSYASASMLFCNSNLKDKLVENPECVKKPGRVEANYNLRLPLANSHERQKAVQDEAPFLKIANLLGLNIEEVTGLSEKNARVNYGVTFVAGHPFSEAAHDQVKKWRQEVLDITKGKVSINADYAHATVGAMFRSQDQAFSSEYFDHINFELVLQAIQEAGPYTIQFTNIQWGSKHDGNIVLVGEVTEGAENLSALQHKFAKAGFDLKWKQMEPGKVVKVYVTLAHINIEALETLSEAEARDLNNWVKAHEQLKEGPTLTVRNINLANYSNRILTETVSPDIVFTLGSKTQFENAQALKEHLLQIWGHTVRFNKLKEITWYGIMSDIDYSLTDENRIVPKKVIKDIVTKIRSGILVGLVSSRGYEITSDKRIFDDRRHQVGGARGIKEVVDQIIEALGGETDPLENLYVFPEDGSYGFRVSDGKILYDSGPSPAATTEDQKAFSDMILPYLENYYQQTHRINYHATAKMIFKEHAITIQMPLSAQVREDATFMRDVLSRIEQFFNDRDIALDIGWSGDAIEIKRKGVNKELAVKEFEKLMHGKPFVSFDDQGQPGGNGAKLINRFGGISLNKHDAGNPDVTSVALLSGTIGADAYLFAVKRLSFTPMSTIDIIPAYRTILPVDRNSQVDL